MATTIPTNNSTSNTASIVRRVAAFSTAAAIAIGTFTTSSVGFAAEPTVEPIEIEVEATTNDARVSVVEDTVQLLQLLDQLDRGDLEAMLAHVDLPDGFIDAVDGLAEVVGEGGSIQDALDFLNRTGFDTSDLGDIQIGTGEDATTVKEVVESIFGGEDDDQNTPDSEHADLVTGDTNPCGVEDPNAVLNDPTPSEAIEWMSKHNPTSGLMTTVGTAEKVGKAAMVVGVAAAVIVATAEGGPSAGRRAARVGKALIQNYDTIVKGSYKVLDKVVEATGGYGAKMQGDEHIDGLTESPMMNELKQALFRDKTHVYAELGEGKDPTLSNPNPFAEDEGSLDEAEPGSHPGGLDGLTNPLDHSGATIADVPCSTFGKLEIAVGEGGVSPTESYPTPDAGQSGEIEPGSPNGPDIGS